MEEEAPKTETPPEMFSTTSTLDTDLKTSKPSTAKRVKEVMKMKTKKDKKRMAIAITGFIIVIALIITGAVLGAKAAKDDDKVNPTEPPKSWYRLPDDLKPLNYQVRLQPFINGNFSIAGYVQVEMQVVKRTSNITLHIFDIITHNDTVMVSSRPSPDGPEVNIKVAKQIYDPEREFYIAMLEEELQVNHLVVLSMSFTGLLNDQLKGFYRSSYTSSEGTKWLAVTQFQADDARMAFPCMDEPALKAEFTITLARETHMTAISNMPLARTEEIEGQEGWVWDHFEPTVPMSTYLVAFLISDFGNLTDGNFAVWSREELLDQANTSLQVGPDILEYYEDYFSIDYPLPKMDMAAIPDFAMGAMENWGLITYREEDMLLPEGSSAAGHQRVLVVVAHELAHQWFGNLVTPSWWTDIWLNEGFASYLEHVGTHHMEPTWRMLDQMVLTMQDVMVADGLTSTHPVSQLVEHPDEINQIFDDISYSKGMSIIRMMNHFLTEDTFRSGLTSYLNNFAYDSATQDDLWEFLTTAAVNDERLPPDVTVKDIMDTWTLQGGYPVVTVARTEDGKGADIAQERFLLAGNRSQESELRWWVPLSYTSADAPDFSNTSPKLWISAQDSNIVLTSLPAKEHWVIFNIHGTGYFRVNYDDANWAKISSQLMTEHTVVEVVTRSQLLDDALSLSRAGLLSYDTSLALVNYLENEEEYVPWSSALAALSYLEQMLTRTAAYGDLRRYLLSLLEPLYSKVGFEDSVEDPHLEQYKRSLAVSWACKMGHKECVADAVAAFQDWMVNMTEVSPNVKSTVYCMGVAEGGQAAWEGVWERYLETEVASEKTHFLRALGCSKELWLLSGYLDMAFTEGSGIRKQDIDLVFSSVAGNDISRTMAWTYLRNEWERIVTYYDSSSSLILSATAEFNTRIEKYELEVFYQEHEASLSTATRAMEIALQNTDGNIAWMDNSYEDVKAWLEDHMTV